MRRLAYEAAVKKLGVRLGNWLTAEQGQALWQGPDRKRLKGKRDRALLALMLACGLRRHEVVALTLDHLQQREEHWAIVDLAGKGGHILMRIMGKDASCKRSRYYIRSGFTRVNRTAKTARMLTRSGNHTGASQGTGMRNSTSESLSECGHLTVAQRPI